MLSGLTLSQSRAAGFKPVIRISSFISILSGPYPDYQPLASTKRMSWLAVVRDLKLHDAALKETTFTYYIFAISSTDRKRWTEPEIDESYRFLIKHLQCPLAQFAFLLRQVRPDCSKLELWTGLTALSLVTWL